MNNVLKEYIQDEFKLKFRDLQGEEIESIYEYKTTKTFAIQLKSIPHSWIFIGPVVVYGEFKNTKQTFNYLFDSFMVWFNNDIKESSNIINRISCYDCEFFINVLIETNNFNIKIMYKKNTAEKN